jgi:N-acetylneuraminate synthase
MLDNSNPMVIAEVGCNHKGSMEIAHEMIKVAAQFCNVDVVKFQKRNPKELLTPEEYQSPHPNPSNSYGETYGEHREYLELNMDEHKKLKHWCEEWGVDYSSSVWDMTSAREVASLNPKLIKVPSACNLKFDMLEFLCKEYNGQIHISLGMTTHEEEEQIISFFEEKGRHKDLVIYSCTSGYPVSFEEICLFELTRLQKNYGDRVHSIGFSGHHLGIAADIAALTLGARWFERLDRTWKGTDHAASLEPDGMRKLTRDINNVENALHYKEKEILDIEDVQRKKLKRIPNSQ